MDAEESKEKLTKIREQIRAWRNRAAMAWKMRNDAVHKQIKSFGKADLSDEALQQTESLVEQALNRMWEYQILEAQIEGWEPPPPPPDPETFFKDFGMGPEGGPRWGPFDPSRIPRQPLPSSGGSEIALPLPEKNDETD